MKFKNSDKVQIVASYSSFIGQIGIISAVHKDVSHLPYNVKFTDKTVIIGFNEDELELIKD